MKLLTKIWDWFLGLFGMERVNKSIPYYTKSMEKVRSEKKGDLIKEKLTRRQQKAEWNKSNPKKHNNGKWVNQNPFMYFGGNTYISSAALQQIEKRHKFKGYEREARRYKKAA